MKKLSYQKQAEIFEKIVNQDGKLFLVRFVVLERGGKLRGKIVSCVPIEVLSGGSAAMEQGCLPLFSHAKTAPTETIRFQRIVSPFSALEFLTSIQIRAPSTMI